MAEGLAKIIILVGLAIVVIGALIWVLGKTGIPFGSLPGDIKIERKGFSFYFPVVTSIILSILLTIIINLIVRFFRR